MAVSLSVSDRRRRVCLSVDNFSIVLRYQKTAETLIPVIAAHTYIRANNPVTDLKLNPV